MTQNSSFEPPHSASSANGPSGGPTSGADVGGSAGSANQPPLGPSAGQPYGSLPGASGGPNSGTSKSGAGFFRAMFDFRFEHFITISFSSFLYVIAWVVAILLWGWDILVAIVFGILIGTASNYGDVGFTPWPLILAILLGWIPSVIAIIAMRLGLEFSVAVVRTAQNTGALVDNASETPSR